MTPAALHEEHKARVLDTPRQHHDEATDALVVEALYQAAAAIKGACGECETCDDAIAKIKAALKAMGK